MNGCIVYVDSEQAGIWQATADVEANKKELV